MHCPEGLSPSQSNPYSDNSCPNPNYETAQLGKRRRLISSSTSSIDSENLRSQLNHLAFEYFIRDQYEEIKQAIITIHQNPNLDKMNLDAEVKRTLVVMWKNLSIVERYVYERKAQEANRVHRFVSNILSSPHPDGKRNNIPPSIPDLTGKLLTTSSSLNSFPTNSSVSLSSDSTRRYSKRTDSQVNKEEKVIEDINKVAYFSSRDKVLTSVASNLYPFRKSSQIPNNMPENPFDNNTQHIPHNIHNHHDHNPHSPSYQSSLGPYVPCLHPLFPYFTDSSYYTFNPDSQNIYDPSSWSYNMMPPPQFLSPQINSYPLYASQSVDFIPQNLSSSSSGFTQRTSSTGHYGSQDGFGNPISHISSNISTNSLDSYNASNSFVSNNVLSESLNSHSTVTMTTTTISNELESQPMKDYGSIALDLILAVNRGGHF